MLSYSALFVFVMYVYLQFYDSYFNNPHWHKSMRTHSGLHPFFYHEWAERVTMIMMLALLLFTCFSLSSTEPCIPLGRSTWPVCSHCVSFFLCRSLSQNEWLVVLSTAHTSSGSPLKAAQTSTTYVLTLFFFFSFFFKIILLVCDILAAAVAFALFSPTCESCNFRWHSDVCVFNDGLIVAYV